MAARKWMPPYRREIAASCANAANELKERRPIWKRGRIEVKRLSISSGCPSASARVIPSLSCDEEPDSQVDRFAGGETLTVLGISNENLLSDDLSFV